MGKRLRWRWVTAVSVAVVLTTSAGADESSWGRMMTPSSPRPVPWAVTRAAAWAERNHCL